MSRWKYSIHCSGSVFVAVGDSLPCRWIRANASHACMMMRPAILLFSFHKTMKRMPFVAKTCLSLNSHEARITMTTTNVANARRLDVASCRMERWRRSFPWSLNHSDYRLSLRRHRVCLIAGLVDCNFVAANECCGCWRVECAHARGMWHLPPTPTCWSV
jgi:hypothetical protein